jgi:SAM-dependent methyltransferase
MSDREAALRLETEYWTLIASGKHRMPERVEAFKKRSGSEHFTPDYLLPYFLPEPGVTRILDVGAGPLTTLGKTRKPFRYVIVPIDPLAESYKTLLDDYGFNPPNPTIYGDAEKLTEQFEEASFDLVYSRNALDHVENPEKALKEMFAVTKRGGHVFFEGNINEGLSENYKQLHKWNFMTVVDGKDGDCVIWNPDGAWLLSSLFGDKAKVSTWRTGWYKVTIAKL